MGISLPQKEIDALLSEVDNSGTGELEMDDFTQMMVLTLQRKAALANDHRAQDRQQPKKHDMQQASLPFEVVALAYRRCAALASGATAIVGSNTITGELAVNVNLLLRYSTVHISRAPAMPVAEQASSLCDHSNVWHKSHAKYMPAGRS